jgi:hypothetical protein
VPSLTEAVAPLFAGRKVVVTGGPLAAMTGTCRRLLELGAQRPFLLATGVGTGEVPGPDEAEWVVVQVRAPDIIAEIRAAMRLLELLPAEVVAALDRWDPERDRPSSRRRRRPCGRRPSGWTAAPAPPGPGTPARGSTAGPTACAGSGAPRTRPRRPPSWPSAATEPG